MMLWKNIIKWKQSVKRLRNSSLMTWKHYLKRMSEAEHWLGSNSVKMDWWLFGKINSLHQRWLMNCKVNLEQWQVYNAITLELDWYCNLRKSNEIQTDRILQWRSDTSKDLLFQSRIESDYVEVEICTLQGQTLRHCLFSRWWRVIMWRLILKIKERFWVV